MFRQKRRGFGNSRVFGYRIGADQIDCCIKLVKKFQPFDPANPKKLFLKDLLNEFAQKAGFSGENKKKIRAFTAVDSIIDKKMGTDAFFEIKENDGTNSILRLDGSINRGKINDGDSKADVLLDLNQLPDPMEDPDEYKIYLQNAAEELARKYSIKFSQNRKAA